MPLESLPPDEKIPVYKAFRHLIFFQIKLFVDAIRDVLMSPVSLVAFIIDAFFRPSVKDSLSFRLMHLGRRSDRVINLFDEYTSSNTYTIDETVAELESALHEGIKKRRE